jgi:hypothetical protein
LLCSASGRGGEGNVEMQEKYPRFEYRSSFNFDISPQNVQQPHQPSTEKWTSKFKLPKQTQNKTNIVRTNERELLVKHGANPNSKIHIIMSYNNDIYHLSVLRLLPLRI